MPRDRLKVMGKSLEGQEKETKRSESRASTGPGNKERKGSNPGKEPNLKEENYEKQKTAPLIFPFFVTSCH